MGTQNDAEDIMEHALREAEQRPAMTTREEFDTLLGGYCRKCETRHDCPDPCELMLKALTYADKRDAEVARLTERVRELEDESARRGVVAGRHRFFLEKIRLDMEQESTAIRDELEACDAAYAESQVGISAPLATMPAPKSRRRTPMPSELKQMLVIRKNKMSREVAEKVKAELEKRTYYSEDEYDRIIAIIDQFTEDAE